MQQPQFEVGDLVFARCKKSRPWPAKIIQNNEGETFKVDFYNNDSYGIVAPNDMEKITYSTIDRYKKIYADEKNKEIYLILEGIKAAESDLNERTAIESAQIQQWKQGVPNQAQEQKLKQLLKPLIQKKVMKPAKHTEINPPKMTKAMQAKAKKAELQKTESKPQPATRRSTRNSEKTQALVTKTQLSLKVSLAQNKKSNKGKPSQKTSARKGSTKKVKPVPKEQMQVEETQIKISLAPMNGRQHQQARILSPTEHLSSDEDLPINEQNKKVQSLLDQRTRPAHIVSEINASFKLQQNVQKNKSKSEEGWPALQKDDEDKMIDEGKQVKAEIKVTSKEQQKSQPKLQELVEMSVKSGNQNNKKDIATLDEQVTFIKNNLQKDSNSDCKSNGPSKSLSSRLKDISPIQPALQPLKAIPQMGLEEVKASQEEDISLKKLNPQPPYQYEYQTVPAASKRQTFSPQMQAQARLMSEEADQRELLAKQERDVKQFEKIYADYSLNNNNYISMAQRIPLLRQQLRDVDSRVLAAYLRRCLDKYCQFIKGSVKDWQRLNLKMWEKQISISILDSELLPLSLLLSSACLEKMINFVSHFEANTEPHRAECHVEYMTIINRLHHHISQFVRGKITSQLDKQACQRMENLIQSYQRRTKTA